MFQCPRRALTIKRSVIEFYQKTRYERIRSTITGERINSTITVERPNI